LNYEFDLLHLKEDYKIGGEFQFYFFKNNEKRRTKAKEYKKEEAKSFPILRGKELDKEEMMGMQQEKILVAA
jgi:hypothetical protein